MPTSAHSVGTIMLVFSPNKALGKFTHGLLLADQVNDLHRRSSYECNKVVRPLVTSTNDMSVLSSPSTPTLWHNICLELRCECFVINHNYHDLPMRGEALLYVT